MSQAEPSKFNLRKEGKLIMNELSDESFQDLLGKIIQRGD